MEVVPWESVPLPARRSPFYALKSIAFDNAAAKVAGAQAGGLLPRVVGRGANGANRDDRVQDRGLERFDVAPAQPINPEEEILQRQIKKRDAALREYEKVDEQLRQAREDLAKEIRMCATSKNQTKDLQEKNQVFDATLQEELKRIGVQHETLAHLRAQVRALQNPDNVVAGGKAHSKSTSSAEPTQQSTRPSSTQAKKANSAGKQTAGDTSTTTSVANLRSSSPPSAVSLGADIVPPSRPMPGNVNDSLEGLFEGVSHVKQAFRGDAAIVGGATEMSAGRHGVGVGGHAGSAEDFGQQEDDDDLACADTQIDIICPQGLRLARLRHSAGFEACVNLQNGRVHSWFLANSNSAAVGSMNVMEPNLPKLSASLGDSPRGCMWRLLFFDDLNNEPSVTLSCGGDGKTPWEVRRRLTVGAGWLQEDITVENLAAADTSFMVEYLESIEGQSPLTHPVREANCFRPRLLKAACESWPLDVTLPAGGCWTACHRWMAGSGPSTARQCA